MVGSEFHLNLLKIRFVVKLYEVENTVKNCKYYQNKDVTELLKDVTLDKGKGVIWFRYS